MGPGSHVGLIPISAKNKNLVYDHPMNISAKFDSNLFCGFRKKDENVKFPYGPIPKSSHGGHLEFPIGKRFTSLVQDHPMIIPAKSQFNWLSGF